jgi:hypothetical protein
MVPPAVVVHAGVLAKVISTRVVTTVVLAKISAFVVHAGVLA